MSNVTLGVHDGHNSAAAIVRDGTVLFAAEEERFTRKKNQGGFPSAALKACLDSTGIAPSEVSQLAFATRRRPQWGSDRSPSQAFHRNASVLGIMRRQFLWYPAYRYYESAGWQARLSAAADLGFKETQCRRYDHHLGHAAAAYFGMRENPSQRYLVITMDGKGDLCCSTVSIAEGSRLRRIAQTPFTDSMGTIYATTTAAMGFVPLEHEYKLMGMAPYAAPDGAELAAERFRSLIEVDFDRLRLRRRTTEPTFLLHRRIRNLISGMRFDEVCAGLQRLCEEIVVTLVRAAIRKTGIRRVLCAGGVFMNVKANKLLMELPEVDYLGIPPSCGDESMSMGIAWHAYAQAGGRAAADTIEPLGPVYLGPDLEEKLVADTVKESGFEYTQPTDIEAELARVLAAGNPVARCKGRMEFGARALGNRSILADPSRPDIVRIINQMIKKRDFWMPFAPLVARDRASDYLVNPKDFASPYMMLSFDTTDRYQDFISAIHNADLTARAQILEESHNDELAHLLKSFEGLTGRSVLLNTSFNLHGSPVVCGPEEAMSVFRSSGLEYLALGPYLVRKQ